MSEKQIAENGGTPFGASHVRPLASEIESDVKRAIIRMRVAIESAERHMAAKTRPPLTVCFCLWSDLQKIEELLKRHDPKPNAASELSRSGGAPHA